MKKVKLILIFGILLVVLMALFVISVSAETRGGTWGDLTWELNTTTGELVISGEGKMNDFDGYNSASAWKMYKISIKSVTIGGGVTSIGYYSFSGCTRLTSITIPDSVTSIHSHAFSDCTGLTSITIPNSVTSIGSNTFTGCSSLESITLPFVGSSAKTASSSYQYPFGYIFGVYSYTGGVATQQYYRYSSSTDNVTYDTYYIPASLKSVTITGGNILYGAFYNCSSLTNITIPDSVTSIGGKAFYNCSSLTSITIPDSVTSIGSSAFYGCYRLIDVYITDIAAWYNISFASSSSNPLYYAKKLHLNDELITALTIPEGVTSIGSYAFSGRTDLTIITIPHSVTSIGDYAFSGCSSLTSITIPASVTSIGSSAFSGCSSLTSITIPASVTSIGDSAFSGCYRLIEVFNHSRLKIIAGSTENGYIAYYAKTVSNSISANSKLFTDSEGYTFYEDGNNCYLIQYTGTGTSLILPANFNSKIYEIYHYAVSCCTDLTSVIIPEGVTSIGDHAFEDCWHLTSITIPDSVTSIGSSVFSGCTDLTSVTFGKNSQLTSIGDYAFKSCMSLTSITIPDSVTSIGSSVFSGCTGLTSITLPFMLNGTGNTHLGYMFGANSYSYNESCVPTSLKTVIITGGASIGDYAFYYCTGLTSITIPASVTSIGSHAFFGCESLTNIYITDITAWYNISFAGYSSNPLYYAKKLHLNGELITALTTIPEDVTSIGDYTFYGRTDLTTITIPASVTSIGDSAFLGCTYLTSVTFGKNSQLTSIGDSAFRDCSLTSITIPDSVTSIGDSAFRDCSLTSITIPDSVTSIGDSAFRDCSLTSITLPFVGASKTASGHLSHFGYIFGYSASSSGSSSDFHYVNFYQSPSMFKYYIPKSLKTVVLTGGSTIGDMAFRKCTGLTSITIPASVTSISSSVFSGCTDLTSVTFGKNSQLTSIGDYAFKSCTGLTSITIPDSVTSIGDSAFKNCTALDTVYLNATVLHGFDDFQNDLGGLLLYAATVAVAGTNPTPELITNFFSIPRKLYILALIILLIAFTSTSGRMLLPTYSAKKTALLARCAHCVLFQREKITPHTHTAYGKNTTPRNTSVCVLAVM